MSWNFNICLMRDEMKEIFKKVSNCRTHHPVRMISIQKMDFLLPTVAHLSCSHSSIYKTWRYLHPAESNYCFWALRDVLRSFSLSRAIGRWENGKWINFCTLCWLLIIWTELWQQRMKIFSKKSIFSRSTQFIPVSCNYIVISYI